MALCIPCKARRGRGPDCPGQFTVRSFASLDFCLNVRIPNNFRHVLHEHGQLVNAIASLVRKDARVILHGPAALCLLDGTVGHVSLLVLRRKNPKSLMEKPHERERLLKRVASSLTPSSCQCFTTSKFVLVTLKGNLEHKKAEITADPEPLMKWFVVKAYIFEYK